MRPAKVATGWVLAADEVSERHRCSAGPCPQIDTETVLEYRRQTEKLFSHGEMAERKRLLRTWVEGVNLMPEALEVSISYRLPEAVMNGLVAGEGFEPSTFGL